jgi:hypothetical protein
LIFERGEEREVGNGMVRSFEVIKDGISLRSYHEVQVCGRLRQDEKKVY